MELDERALGSGGAHQLFEHEAERRRYFAIVLERQDASKDVALQANAILHGPHGDHSNLIRHASVHADRDAKATFTLFMKVASAVAAPDTIPRMSVASTAEDGVTIALRPAEMSTLAGRTLLTQLVGFLSESSA
ncbi:MAG TPA: hypothetical protein VLM79_08520 [Kofleriaceae bacterium]|nr:hypothetical protein [Kofleriaceae bacterium]